jgi:hypothetical protein
VTSKPERVLGVFAAAPIVAGAVILLVRAAVLQVDVLRPPFAGALIASLIGWPVLVVVCAAWDAIVRPAPFWQSVRRGGITGAIAATIGWLAVVVLIEGLFRVDERGVHRSIGDPEDIGRSLAPFLLPVVAALGYFLGGFAGAAGWGGRRLSTRL